MPNELKQKMRIVNLCGIAAALLLLTGTAALGVYPTFQRGQRNIRDVQSLQNDIPQLDLLNQTLLEKQEALKKPAERLSQVEDQIPAVVDINHYDKELASAASANGIRISSSTTPKELKDWGSYKLRTVTVGGAGDWDAVYRFLNDIRKMNGVTRLDTLVLELDRDPKILLQDKPQCQFHVTFSTFFTTR